ncbi:MAG: YaaA family protein [Alphaproteobacteria bacterium]|nr:YaaA family protein [Alphaproteobacteria bacterium]
MLILISPAKKLYSAEQLADLPTPPLPATRPLFHDRTQQLVAAIRAKKTPRQPNGLRTFLAQTMAISEKLAIENEQRYLQFRGGGGTPALFTFAGDTFLGLAPRTWSMMEQQTAARHLYILSGLYGLLATTDLIEPYRLEMGAPIDLLGHRYPHTFWHDSVTTILSKEKNIIVNCASHEYSRVVAVEKMSAPFITIDFKIKKNGRLQSPGMPIKNLRGRFAHALIQQLTNIKSTTSPNTHLTPDAIRATTIGHFVFDNKISRDDYFCFIG